MRTLRARKSVSGAQSRGRGAAPRRATRRRRRAASSRGGRYASAHSFDDFASLAFDDDVAEEVDLMMKGPAGDILSEHTRLAKKTEALLAQNVREISANLKKTPRYKPKTRARLALDLSEAEDAVRASREKFAEEHAKLKVALKSMKAASDKPAKEMSDRFEEEARIESARERSAGRRAVAAILGVGAAYYYFTRKNSASAAAAPAVSAEAAPAAA